MALLFAKRLSPIKVLAKQGYFSNRIALHSTTRQLSKFSTNVATHQLLFNQQNVENKQQLARRYASTTTKKGNVFAFTHELSHTHSLDELNQSLDLSFEDSKTAFKSKSNFELLRGFLVFQLCSINFLLDNQKMVCHIHKAIFMKNHLF